LSRFRDEEEGAIVDDVFPFWDQVVNPKLDELVDEGDGNVELFRRHFAVWQKAGLWRFHEIHGSALSEGIPVDTGPFPPEDLKILGAFWTVVFAMNIQKMEAFFKEGIPVLVTSHCRLQGADASIVPCRSLRQIGRFP